MRPGRRAGGERLRVAELRRGVTGERAVECRRERLGIRVLCELVHASLVPADEVDLGCEYRCRVFAGGTPDSQGLDRSPLGRPRSPTRVRSRALSTWRETAPPAPSACLDRGGEPVVFLGFSHHAGVQAGQRAAARRTPSTPKIVVGGREQQVPPYSRRSASVSGARIVDACAART